MEKDIHANGNQKKLGVAILMSDKIGFEPKMIIREKESHYRMMKWSINQEGVTIINKYSPNIRAPKNIKQILTDMKGEIDNNTIFVGGFSTLLSTMDSSSRQKIDIEMMDLNHTLDQMDLRDISRTFHWTTVEYTFSQVHMERSQW